MGNSDHASARSFSDSDARAVYDLAAEFGQARSVPLVERVYSHLPHLNEGQVAAVIEHVQRFEGRAWTLAEKIWDDAISKESAKSSLAREFPELADRAGRAMSQAMYFVAK